SLPRSHGGAGSEAELPSGPPLLSVQSLVKDFGGLRAVNHCSFDVERGSITGLIGPNGAGKTTLFSLVSGFHTPDSGRVYLDGEAVTGLPSHLSFRKGLSRTFRSPREHNSMAVTENLMLVPKGQIGEKFWNPVIRPGAVRRQERELREKAREVLEFVEQTHMAQQPAGAMSGG